MHDSTCPSLPSGTRREITSPRSALQSSLGAPACTMVTTDDLPDSPQPRLNLHKHAPRPTVDAYSLNILGFNLPTVDNFSFLACFFF